MSRVIRRPSGRGEYGDHYAAQEKQRYGDLTLLFLVESMEERRGGRQEVVGKEARDDGNDDLARSIL
jgi:hypothetical protein